MSLAFVTFQLPVFSAILLLVAGALVGYAICYPFRTDSVRISSELRELHRQNLQLQGSLQGQRDAYGRLERNYLEQQQEWAHLHLSQDKLITAINDCTKGESSQTASQAQQLRSQCESLFAELEREQRVRVELDTALHDARTRIQMLEQEVREQAQRVVANEQDAAAYQALQARQLQEAKERQGLRVRHDKLTGLHGEIRRRARHLQAERDSLAQAQAAVTTEVERLRAQLGRQLQTTDKIRQQREELLSDLRHAQHERAKLAKSLTDQTQRVDQLERQDRSATSLQGTIAELRDQLEESNTQLAQTIAERDQVLAEVVEYESAVERLEDQLGRRTAAAEMLSRERDELKAMMIRQEVILAGLTIPMATEFTEVPPLPTPAHDTRRDARLGLVYIEAPPYYDDLKQISGVTATLEQRLNAYGIYTYRQITEWDQTAIDEFSELLSFKDRIECEDWIGQARRLDRQHHDRAA